MGNKGEGESVSPPKTSKDAAESPYLAARREWNERYGSYIVRANHWRLAAFASMAVAIIAVSGLVVVSAQHKVVPFVVRTNAHGEPMSVRRADVASKPTENEIRAALRQWLIGARTVYVDLNALQSIVDTTYAMTLPNSPAFRELASYHRENNPYQRASDVVVDVAVKAVVPVSEESWNIEWTEVVKQRSGRQLSSQNWQGTLTVAIAPPTDAKQIMINPIGVYVHQFSWIPRLQ